MGSSKKVTVGYWYHPTFHLAACRGPVDSLLKIRAADVDAWHGSLTDNGTLSINEPGLWGGKSSEGGIVGDIDVMFGGEAQAANSAVSVIGADPSAHRGLLSLLFKGGRWGAMNPYPKTISLMVQRVLQGWDDGCWYSAKAPIVIGYGPPITYAEGADTLASWTLVSGSFNFTNFTSVFFGLVFNCIQQSSGTSSVITRALSLGFVPTEVSFYFQVPSSASDDATLLTVGSWVMINPRREAFYDGARRCWLYVAGNLVYVPTFALATWYRLVLTVSGGTANWEIRRVSDNYLHASGSRTSSVYNSAPTSLTLTTDSGGLTCPTQYAGITMSSTVGLPLNGINPAHAIYYSLSADGMQGEPVELINDASFTAAADLFYNEGLGICTVWDPDQETVEQFRSRICEAVGARCSRSTVDGQWYLDVMRGQYVLGSLPILTDDDILDFEGEPAVLDDAVNQLAVQWFDPITKQERTTAPIHALGAIDGNAVNAQTLAYNCLPTETLALRTAARELRARATPLWRYKLTTNRKPYSWRTGTYFRLQAPKRGVADMVCLVGDIEKGTLRSGAISLTALQDVFAMPATTYVEAQPPIEPPSTTPVPVTEQRAMETPYIELAGHMSAVELGALAADAGYLMTLGARPGTGANYELNTRPGTGDYQSISTFDWCPIATIVEASSSGETSFTISDGILLERVDLGTAALWGDEIVRVDALDTTAGTITIGRGCADTVPAVHAAGERIWFYDAWSGADQIEYVDGETADAKLLTRTGTSILSIDSATAVSVTFGGRAARPLPPGNLQINGAAWPTVVNDALAITWAHRDRELQADQLVDTTQASIGPEAGTTYTVRLLSVDHDVLLDEATGLTGTSHTLSGAFTGEVYLQLWSVRDGLSSWQIHEHRFTYLGTGGRVVEPGGAYRLAESGDYRVQE